MDLSDIEVPRVFVTYWSKLTLIKTIRSLIRGTIREELFRQTCFGWFLDMDDWTENCILLHFMLGQQLELTDNENEIIPLYYHIVDNFYIRFGREEFCLVSGLKFGVENFTDYNKAKDPIPFRRRVFSSDLDGRPLRGKDVGLLIESDVFKKLDDNDDVSLCCVGILQLVLLGVEDKRHVPNWILSDPTNETDTKSYSIEGFAWAFKTWILESFRAVTDDYYTRYRRHPRIVAWSFKHKFYRDVLKHMLHGQLPVERLVPDETEARSRWGYEHMKKKNVDMYEKMIRFVKDMRWVPEANMLHIIADQHFGVSDISEFQSYQGVPSAFHTLANNSSFFNMATPSNLQTPNQSNWLSPSNWHTPNPSYLGTSNSQPPIPSQPGTSNWQNPMTSLRQDAGILDPGYKLPSFFWPQLVPHLCTYRRERSWPEGWLSIDHMDSWIQILIRERTENANWTLAKSGTVCLHPENNRFMILTDPHNIETLDGSVRPFPSWNDVT
nr:phospholipase-like protein [Tanacetum cinerariifolium]